MDPTLGMSGRMVVNQPHDEEVNLSEGSEDPLLDTRETDGVSRMMGDGEESREDELGAPPPHEIADMNEYDDDLSSPEVAPRPGGMGMRTGSANDRRPEGAAGGSRGGSQQQQRAAPAAGLDGAVESSSGGPVQDYRPEDYAHLNDRVTPAVRELFAQIQRYKPQQVALDTQLKPFIPEYIPALGEIDEFVKVPRPDGRPDYLGMKVLDEPSLRQSDRALLTLQLKNLTKAPVAALEVAQVEAVDDSDPAALAKRLSTWISSVEDLHKSKPPQEVTYSKNMPDLEHLMQEWPEEVEQVLRSHQGHLPGPHTPMAASQMARALCALLDIPVYYNVVESLHVLFTLYLEMRNLNPAIAQSSTQGPGTFLSLSQSGPMKQL